MWRFDLKRVSRGFEPSIGLLCHSFGFGCGPRACSFIGLLFSMSLVT